jgi:hypothetical protein
MKDPDELDADGAGATEPAESKRPSTTPSWVMLGFAAGVLFMWLLRATVEEPAVLAPAPVAPSPVRVTTPPVPMEIEAVFAQYSEYAQWTNDLTEVVLWNRGAQAVVDRFEIRRVGETLYFRTIPQLTRRVLNHGVPENLPIQFTETEAQYQQWLRDVAQENSRQMSKGIIEAFSGRRVTDPAEALPAPPAQANPTVQPPAGGK